MKPSYALAVGAYVLIAIGLLVISSQITFRYGAQEFWIGMLTGCAGIGLFLGGVCGAISGLADRDETSEMAEMGMAPGARSLALATKVSIVSTLIIATIGTVVSGAGHAVLFALGLALGCCR